MNTRDGLADLPANEARVLENWTPTGSAVTPRGGLNEVSDSGVALSIETLAAYEGPAGTALIGIVDGDVYDLSAAAGSLIDAAGYTDSRFQTEMYNGWLFGVNGVDTPWRFDGSAIAATGFSGSGLTIADLVNVRKVRNRLWFCQKNSADVWYGPLGGVTGTLTKFQLSQIAGGGYCMAIGAHSVDGGAGPDDYTVFVMSTGEVIVYTGDPSSTFSKVGNYTMPPPVSRQCLVNIGGPLAVVTTMGLVPLQAGMQGVAFDTLAIGPFGKVAPSIQSDAQSYGSLDGWAVNFAGGYVVINVPVFDGGLSRQWVYNTLTGAWCRWSRIDAASMTVYLGRFHFGAWQTGKVYDLSGVDDDGVNIPLTARQAAYREPSGKKLIAKAVRFDFDITGEVDGRFGLDVDFVQRPITIPSMVLAQAFATTPWGSDWGSDWSTADQYKGQWFSTYAEGRAIGLALEATGNAAELLWHGSHLLIQGTAGPL